RYLLFARGLDCMSASLLMGNSRDAAFLAWAYSLEPHDIWTRPEAASIRRWCRPYLGIIDYNGRVAMARPSPFAPAKPCVLQTDTKGSYVRFIDIASPDLAGCGLDGQRFALPHNLTTSLSASAKDLLC